MNTGKNDTLQVSNLLSLAKYFAEKDKEEKAVKVVQRCATWRRRHHEGGFLDVKRLERLHWCGRKVQP